MNPNRVPENVRVAQLAREIGCGRVALEEVVDRFFRQRVAAALLAPEKIWAAIGGTYGEVGAQELPAARMHRMPVRLAAFEPGDEHLIALEVTKLQQGCLATSKTVPVHEVEEKEVADVLFRNRLEKALGLFLRVVLDRPLFARSACPYAASPATRSGLFARDMNGDFAGNPGFH